MTEIKQRIITCHILGVLLAEFFVHSLPDSFVRTLFVPTR